MERPSVSDQLFGAGQDLVRLALLVLVALTGVSVLFRHDGVDVVVRHAGEDVDKPRWGASIALFRQ